jgi:tRNA nucleotidyltransferase (CCA-adding enzyme)
MKVPDKSEDTIWPQLRKVSWLIKDYAERFGFEIWYLIPSVKGNVGMIFMLAPKKTLKSRLAKGPSVLLKEAQVEFLEKHKNALGVTFFDDKIYALEKNKYSKLEEVLRYVVTGKLKKRHKDISMSGAKLFVGHVPAEYAQLVYSGLLQKISI